MSKYKPIPMDVVEEFIVYVPKTGDLLWRKQRGGRGKAGAIAGYVDKEGYRRIRLGQSLYKAHRIVWAIHYGECPRDMEIDHINCDTWDNRIENLRLCSRSENARNRRITKANKSGLKGVSWSSSSKTWVAQICFNRSSLHIGYFASKVEAHRAYCVEAKRLHSAFARAA